MYYGFLGLIANGKPARPGKRQSRGKCHRIQFFQKNIVARKSAKSLRFFLLSFAVFATLRENLGSGPYYHYFNLLSARMTDPCPPASPVIQHKVKDFDEDLQDQF